MEYLKNYITILNDMLSTIFFHTENTCIECKSVLNSYEQSSPSLNGLRESVARLTVLLQFGDIISQSFESFDVIFDEITRLEKIERKLSFSQAERFSKLIGAVSTNTFSLTGRTLYSLKEDLIKAVQVIGEMEESDQTRKCIKVINGTVSEMERSVQTAVMKTRGMGLFSLDSIFSPFDPEQEEVLSERLHQKIRVREHIEILNGLFPTGKNYSSTGSLELF